MAPRGYSLKNLVPYSGWLWRAFVNALIENDEKVASSQNVHNRPFATVGHVTDNF